MVDMVTGWSDPICRGCGFEIRPRSEVQHVGAAPTFTWHPSCYKDYQEKLSRGEIDAGQLLLGDYIEGNTDAGQTR